MIRSAPATLAVLLLAAPAAAFVATDGELKQRLVGTWGEEPACTGRTLTFRSDSTFAYALPNGHVTRGTWDIVDGVLSGTRQGGAPQPDATIAFGTGDRTLTMTEITDRKREGIYHRCAPPGIQPKDRDDP